MSDHASLRAMVSLLLVAVVAVVGAYLGAGTEAVVAVIATGIAAIAICLASWRSELPLPSDEPLPSIDIEAAVIDAIAEPVLLVTDSRVRAANGPALLMLGRHIVGEDVRVAIRHPGAASRLASDALDGSVELMGIGGREQQVELHVATIAPGKRIVHLIDRAARHAVEQARVDFVANASHELRTPLAAILGFIETLADEKAGGDAEVRARFLEVMLKEARRMQRLIDDLISLSRIEAEKYDLPAETVSLPALVREVAGELRDQQGDQPSVITFDIDAESKLVTGDRAQLSQLVHNLAGNAIKYGRPGTPVVIGVKPDGQLVRLTVTDEGEGIAAEHVPRLTERFYRVDSGRSRSMGGTGLGLAIVKHIVERHRARLEIQSVLGKGTTVSVLFPVVPRGVVAETSQQ